MYLSQWHDNYVDMRHMVCREKGGEYIYKYVCRDSDGGNRKLKTEKKKM